MKKADKKAELLKRLQNELDIRTQVEKEAVSLISNAGSVRDMQEQFVWKIRKRHDCLWVSSKRTPI